MKKILTFLSILIIHVSCGVLNGNYPLTTFIVKNTSEKEIIFSASVIIHSTINGPQIVNSVFIVKPQDSVIARQTYFKRDGENPQGWFHEFKITPVKGLEFNDPKKRENWIKSSRENVPIYTFIINK